MTYRLGETHQTIEVSRVAGELNGLKASSTEGVLSKLETSDSDIICHNITRNGSRAIGDLELLLGVDETGGALGAEEDVVTLSRSNINNLILARVHTVGRIVMPL